MWFSAFGYNKRTFKIRFKLYKQAKYGSELKGFITVSALLLEFLLAHRTGVLKAIR